MDFLREQFRLKATSKRKTFPSASIVFGAGNPFFERKYLFGGLCGVAFLFKRVWRLCRPCCRGEERYTNTEEWNETESYNAWPGAAARGSDVHMWGAGFAHAEYSGPKVRWLAHPCPPGITPAWPSKSSRNWSPKNQKTRSRCMFSPMPFWGAMSSCSKAR